MLSMYKDLRTSVERRLIPISKLHIFSNIFYLMQSWNIKKRQIYFSFSCTSDCVCMEEASSLLWSCLHDFLSKWLGAIFLLLFLRWHTDSLHLTWIKWAEIYFYLLRLRFLGLLGVFMFKDMKEDQFKVWISNGPVKLELFRFCLWLVLY